MWGEGLFMDVHCHYHGCLIYSSDIRQHPPWSLSVNTHEQNPLWIFSLNDRWQWHEPYWFLLLFKYSSSTPTKSHRSWVDADCWTSDPTEINIWKQSVPHAVFLIQVKLQWNFDREVFLLISAATICTSRRQSRLCMIDVYILRMLISPEYN